jgi:metal-dependent amidase/aminoacylase/carboxypeptidase family protein
MLRDGLFKRSPRPDICLKQHVLPLAAGMVGHNVGVIMSSSINVDIRLFGKGGHGTALLGSENVVELPTAMASEDFSQYGLPGRHQYYGEPIPYCVWVFGGHSRGRYNAAPGDSLIAKMPYLSSNHQPNFIPDPEPMLRTGVHALTSAALAYLPATGSVQKTAYDCMISVSFFLFRKICIDNMA